MTSQAMGNRNPSFISIGTFPEVNFWFFPSDRGAFELEFKGGGEQFRKQESPRRVAHRDSSSDEYTSPRTVKNVR